MSGMLIEGDELDGRFRIERLLAQGGMGAVYEALDLGRGGRRVALKLLHRRLTRDSTAAARFRREAEVLRGVRHPAIVAIEDAGSLADGTCYLALELLRGETLADHLSRHGPMGAHELAPIVTLLCEALAEVHAAGIVHRDLKPSNVFLPSTEELAAARRSGARPLVKLLDFGVAKVFGEVELTKTGLAVGTLRYMSPEQLQGSALDHRVDVYALGVLAYLALSGEHPFRGQGQALVASILTGRVVPLTDRAPVSGAVAEVVHRAISLDRERRFGTTAALAEAFAGAAQGRGQGPTPTLAQSLDARRSPSADGRGATLVGTPGPARAQWHTARHGGVTQLGPARGASPPPPAHAPPPMSSRSVPPGRPSVGAPSLPPGTRSSTSPRGQSTDAIRASIGGLSSRRPRVALLLVAPLLAVLAAGATILVAEALEDDAAAGEGASAWVAVAGEAVADAGAEPALDAAPSTPDAGPILVGREPDPRERGARGEERGRGRSRDRDRARAEDRAGSGRVIADRVPPVSRGACVQYEAVACSCFDASIRRAHCFLARRVLADGVTNEDRCRRDVEEIAPRCAAPLEAPRPPIEVAPPFAAPECDRYQGLACGCRDATYREAACSIARGKLALFRRMWAEGPQQRDTVRIQCNQMAMSLLSRCE